MLPSSTNHSDHYRVPRTVSQASAASSILQHPSYGKGTVRSSQRMLSTITEVYLLTLNLQVNYTQPFRDQLSIAFDTYLIILAEVRKLVSQALGRDDPDWHLKYGCPCCGFEVPGEPPLNPARMHAMDGNSSAMRVDGSGFTDQRTFHGTFDVPMEYVDQFKDEVQPKPAAATQNEGCPDRNFKAADTIDNPTALDNFEQTGIFLMTCRNHIVEMITEMVKSGELYVVPFIYPISTNNVHDLEQSMPSRSPTNSSKS